MSQNRTTLIRRRNVCLAYMFSGVMFTLCLALYRETMGMVFWGSFLIGQTAVAWGAWRASYWNSQLVSERQDAPSVMKD